MDDDLDTNWRDRLAQVTKIGTGFLDLIGGPLGELVGEVIPKQRLDRVVIFLRHMEKRLQTLEIEQVKSALADPNKIDLIETGGYQAARAIADERIRLIAEVVFNGIKAPEADAIRRNRLLKLLGELDDDEIAILNAHGQSYSGNNHEAWSQIERPGPAHSQAGRGVFDQNALYDVGKAHLKRIGLLKLRYPALKKGEYPEFDKNTGEFKGSVEISSLGRLLLREIGMPSPIDQRDTD